MSTQTRLAVVGAGLVGIRHIEAISRATDVELAAVVDTNDAARDIVTNHKVKFYGSLQHMFEDQTPDGVVLATPTGLHVQQGLHCIDQGCPILVEKPISTTACEALKLVNHAALCNLPVLVGHHRRHNPLVQQAYEMIKEGKIGNIRMVQGTCWFYKPEDYFDNGPWRKKAGAGPISVNLIHDVDLMRYFLGEVVRVQAAASKSIRGYENEDVAAAVLTFENGAVGTISVSDAVVSPWSWELTAKENPCYPATSQSSLLIGGSEGSLSIPDLTLWTHSGERSWWNGISATSVPQDFSDPLVNQIVHFANVIHRQACPLVSGLEGMKTLQVIEAIQDSAAQGQAIDITQQVFD